MLVSLLGVFLPVHSTMKSDLRTSRKNKAFILAGAGLGSGYCRGRYIILHEGLELARLPCD